jgi:DNA mismatch repair ATPase MutL
MTPPSSLLSKTELAEKYIEILQPIEVFISHYYRQHPEIYDSDVLHTYQALLKDIKTKLTKLAQPQHSLKSITNVLYEQQNRFLNKFQESYSLEEIQLCLKQLEKSVKFWSREHGSRGYLNYIYEFN